MKRWMKRNTIIFIINWWAKKSSPAFLLLSLTVLISCRKEGDFNLGSKPQDSNIGVQFTDTVTLLNKTFLLNDSIVSARANNLSFGGYSDPSYTGVTYCEAYASVRLVNSNVDYSGTTVDSAKLYMYYSLAYGDTLSSQDVSVHEITTQLDASVPYRTNSNFVTYSAASIGEKTGFQARPYTNHSLDIPLTNAFGTNLLAIANNKNNTDFQNLFYGIMIKPKNNSVGSVISADYTTSDLARTRMIVYFKRGTIRDSATFSISNFPSSFNRVIDDRSGTNIASLVSNGDRIEEALTGNRCYIQSGTGIVTKVEMPYLKNLSTVDGNSVIINKAVLVAPIDLASNYEKYRQVNYLRLLQMNTDNTYKYAANGSLAYIQGSGYPQTGTNYSVLGTALDITDTTYRIDITSYVQSLLSNHLDNNGFIFMPVYNSFMTSRTVLYGANATDRKMRLEIYYTKVK